VNANLLVSNYQLESRMREIRQSGSVGGEPQSNAASLPLLIRIAHILATYRAGYSPRPQPLDVCEGQHNRCLAPKRSVA
jgi:hypothetical protein